MSVGGREPPPELLLHWIIRQELKLIQVPGTEPSPGEQIHLDAASAAVLRAYVARGGP